MAQWEKEKFGYQGQCKEQNNSEGVDDIVELINNYSLKSRWIVAKYLPSHEVAR